MTKQDKMKRLKTVSISAFTFLGFLFSHSVSAQAKLVMNGATINLANGAFLVLENPAPTAIIHKSGQVISEGENNQIKWLTGNTAGTYNIPFGKNVNNYIPLTFTKSAGTGNGYFLLATYGTG